MWNAKRWLSIFVLAAVTCLTVGTFGMADAAEDGKIEGEVNEPMVIREMATPDGGTATIRFPERYADQMTPQIIQDFAADCRHGERITVYEINAAE